MIELSTYAFETLRQDEEFILYRPSDIRNVQGKMHETTVPRIPGRDFAGTVVQGPDELLGLSVFGSGGNLGFGRDGSHAGYLAVPVTAVIPLPKNLSFEQAAGIGVAYLTALGSAGQCRANPKG